MSKFKNVVVGTLIFWLVFTASYAYLYVTSRLGLTGAEGYENEWDWQLFFFALTRLPFLAIALAAAIWFEVRFLRKKVVGTG